MPGSVSPNEDDGSTSGSADVTYPFLEFAAELACLPFPPLRLVGGSLSENQSILALSHSPSSATNSLSSTPSLQPNPVSPRGTMPELNAHAFSMYEMRAAVSAAVKAIQRREGGGERVRGLASLDIDSATILIKETILKDKAVPLARGSVTTGEKNLRERREKRRLTVRLGEGHVSRGVADSPPDEKFSEEGSGSAGRLEQVRIPQVAESGWAHSWDDEEGVEREKAEKIGEELEEQNKKPEGEKIGRKRDRNWKPNIAKQVSTVESPGTDNVDDGFKWRKYGQKSMKNNKHPRNYYKCTHVNCKAKKRVNRCPTNESLLLTSYVGEHSHPGPALLRRRVPLPASGARQKLLRKSQGGKGREGGGSERQTELSNGTEGSNVGAGKEEDGREEDEGPHGISSESR